MNATRTAAPAASASARRGQVAPGGQPDTSPVHGEGSARRLSTSLSPEQLASIRDELDADLVRLRQSADGAARDVTTRAGDDETRAGHDSLDTSTHRWELGQEASLADHTRALLAETQRARQRIEDGTYGFCESCGGLINPERILAFPRVTLCLPCRQQLEHQMG